MVVQMTEPKSGREADPEHAFGSLDVLSWVGKFVGRRRPAQAFFRPIVRFTLDSAGGIIDIGLLEGNSFLHGLATRSFTHGCGPGRKQGSG